MASIMDFSGFLADSKLKILSRNSKSRNKQKSRNQDAKNAGNPKIIATIRDFYLGVPAVGGLYPETRASWRKCQLGKAPFQGIAS